MGETAHGTAVAPEPRATCWSRLAALRRGPVRVVLEVGVVLVCAAEVLAWERVAASSSFVVAVLAVAAVVARHRWPVAAAVVAGPALGWTALLLTPLVLLFTAGRRERRDGVVAALVAWTVVSSAALMTWQDHRYLAAEGPLRLVTDVAAAVAMAAGAAGLGRLVRARQEQAAVLRQLVAGRAREQALAERAARADERAHLAREMHDAVASQVTLIAVQAAGLRMTPDVDERTREVAEVIRTAAVQTTRELREVLLDLRAPRGPAPTGTGATGTAATGTAATGTAATGTGPAVVLEASAGPCLRELDRLWEASGCTGQLVVSVPEASEVPEPVQRAAYRILQEGLTNAVRYAPGAVVRAGVEVVASTLVVSVVNGPAGAVPAGQPAEASELSTGHGLAGVRERAGAVGGHAGWGPTPSGGHQLTAVLPLGGPAVV